MRILELDAGNSRIKWRHLDEESGNIIAEGISANPEALLRSDAVARQPDLARLCSVRTATETDMIREWMASKWNLELQVAAVTRSCSGVTNQYQDTTRLGTDRWLAMLAAFNAGSGPCLVVDAGTALTVDLVDASGLHHGGYILPGRRLMASSLETNTLIRLSAQKATGIAPGNDTDNAVLNGILASQIALIERAADNLDTPDASAQLFLTGGDADLFSGHLPGRKLQVRPALVLDGLAFACPAVRSGQAGR